MGKTSISWCDYSFNPWWGCAKVSPACTHCYAETFSKRIGLKVWGPDSGRRFFGPEHWLEPERWNRAAKRARTRRRVFCASMADVFEDRPDLEQPRAQLFDVIQRTPWLDWLLLTKRPENITRLWPAGVGAPGAHGWPNVWLGTTVESQDYAKSRIWPLLQTPAAIRFISAEPLLGPLDLDAIEALCREWSRGLTIGTYLDWVIAGGESGAHCRPPDPDWFRRLRDQCVDAGIAFHFKQWGGLHPKANGCELDGREWKEFPRVAA